MENFLEYKNLTIDNIYRGRFEQEGQLFEFDQDKRAYFYVEFYQNFKIELLCDKIACTANNAIKTQKKVRK